MPTTSLDARLGAAREIAREAGALALDYFRDLGSLTVERKGAQDEVSAADRAVEARIRQRLAENFPGEGILGEEGGLVGSAASSTQGSEGLWVVDPIDGTACFIVGIPVWCVSIAWIVGGEPTIGVVYDPNADEMFAARRGGGATLNNKPIRLNDDGNLEEGSVGVGYSMRCRPEDTLRFLEPLLDAGGMFQRNGSGALMLAYVAAGRLLGYYEPHINSWDCLAAICVVNEAGGWTNDFLAGDGLTAGNPIAAAAPGVTSQIKSFSGLG
ncbi:MAG: inositol monophosphatase [Pseudomonadota bacterium]